MRRSWTTAQLLENVANYTGHDVEDVAEIVGTFLKEASSLVELGHDVRLSHLGMIRWVNTPERNWKDPRTGEMIFYPKAKKPKMRLIRGLARLRNEQ